MLKNGKFAQNSFTQSDRFKISIIYVHYKIQKDKRRVVVVYELWATSTLQDSVGMSDRVAGRQHLTRQPFL